MHRDGGHYIAEHGLAQAVEELTGARFTTSCTRIGGLTRDVPEGWVQKVDAFCDQFLPILEEIKANS